MGRRLRPRTLLGPLLLFAALGGVLAGCEIGMRPDFMEPGLRPAVADPGVLAELCGVPIDELGPVSNRSIELSHIEASRSTLGNRGQGTAELRYTRANGGAPCQGRIGYDFQQPEGRGSPNIRNLRVLR